MQEGHVAANRRDGLPDAVEFPSPSPESSKALIQDLAADLPPSSVSPLVHEQTVEVNPVEPSNTLAEAPTPSRELLPDLDDPPSYHAHSIGDQALGSPTTSKDIPTRLTVEGHIAPSNPGLPPTEEALWEEQRSLISPIYAYWEVKRLLREAQDFQTKEDSFDR